MRTARWKILVGYVTTLLYVPLFIGVLCAFHLPQRAAALVSRPLQKKVLDLMNISILLVMRFVGGVTFTIDRRPALPSDRSVILVSNHQSMYDIPLLMWLLRDREVGFIAKEELSRWLPSISFALRTLGSVLIDRKDAERSIEAIARFAEKKEREKQVAAIFPEGTRAKDGIMKRFKATGLRTLVNNMPEAVIQPVAIDGGWEFLRYKFFPVPYGTHTRCSFLTPIEPGEVPVAELPMHIERLIGDKVGEWRRSESEPIECSRLSCSTLSETTNEEVPS